jgi:hypothetical protein
MRPCLHLLLLLLPLCSGGGSGTTTSIVRGGEGKGQRWVDSGRRHRGGEEQPSSEGGDVVGDDSHLRRAFFKHLAGDDVESAARVRSPAPRVNVYGVGTMPAAHRHHPLAALAGAPIHAGDGPFIPMRMVQAMKLLLWVAIRLMHKVAWGLHVLSAWVETRDRQLKHLRARRRGRPLRGLGTQTKLRASPLMHVFSDDPTLRGAPHAIRQLLNPEKHGTVPGREYVMEMQRQAAGIG